MKADQECESFDDQSVTYVCGTTSVEERDTKLRCLGLSEGIYFIAANVEWSRDTQDKVFHLSSYGAGKVHF